MADFLSMGGYAAYVWPAFGFAACVLVGLLGQSWRLARRREAELDRLRGAAGRAPGAAGPPQVRRRAAVRVPAADSPGAGPAATARE